MFPRTRILTYIDYNLLNYVCVLLSWLKKKDEWTIRKQVIKWYWYRYYYTFSESSAASNEKREILGRIIFPKIKMLRVAYYSNCRNILSLRFISRCPTMPLLQSIAISGFNEQHRSGMVFTEEDQVIGNEHLTRSLRPFNKLFFVNLFHYLLD